MLARRYLTSVKNLPAIMEAIIAGTAPERFTHAHLKAIGFRSSNDRAVIALLKDLGFLTDDGSPTTRYHEYRDQSRSAAVMAEALTEAYSDIFTINENPTKDDRPLIEGRFKSIHNISDRVAKMQAMTFFALLELSDLQALRDDVPQHGTTTNEPVKADPETPSTSEPAPKALGSSLALRYNIEVHLPATKDVAVYNAIFKSLREHLIVD